MTETETPASKKNSTELKSESRKEIVNPFLEKIETLTDTEAIKTELGSATLALAEHFNVDEELGDSPSWKEDPEFSPFWDDMRALNTRIGRYQQQADLLAKAARDRIAAL